MMLDVNIKQKKIYEKKLLALQTNWLTGLLLNSQSNNIYANKQRKDFTSILINHLNAVSFRCKNLQVGYIEQIIT